MLSIPNSRILSNFSSSELVEGVGACSLDGVAIAWAIAARNISGVIAGVEDEVAREAEAAAEVLGWGSNAVLVVPCWMKQSPVRVGTLVLCM